MNFYFIRYIGVVRHKQSDLYCANLKKKVLVIEDLICSNYEKGFNVYVKNCKKNEMGEVKRKYQKGKNRFKLINMVKIVTVNQCMKKVTSELPFLVTQEINFLIIPTLTYKQTTIYE